MVFQSLSLSLKHVRSNGKFGTENVVLYCISSPTFTQNMYVQMPSLELKVLCSITFNPQFHKKVSQQVYQCALMLRQISL